MDGSMLFGNGNSIYSKQYGTIPQQAKVLITVKAAPVPSTTYGDTVCVAGIRVTDDGPEWVRLFPIPFRHLDELEQFTKYQFVDLPIVPAANDPRAESFKPDRNQMVMGEILPPWKARHPYVMPLANRWTMCEIQRKTDNGEPAPSLAVVTPSVITKLEVKPHPGWTADEERKIEQHLHQGDLFTGTSTKKKLEAPRFQGWYHYKCQESDCNGHRQMTLDWEFLALQRRHTADPDDVTIAALKKRFFDEQCAPKWGRLFFVGNQAKRHRTFSIIGTYASLG